MTKINLGSEQFEVASVKIFNDGKAGVTVADFRVEKKAQGDTSNSPDYTIYYIDEKGAEVNRGFWYMDEKDPKFKERIVWEGKVLRHLVEVVYEGKDMPSLEFESAKEMLDGVMSLIQKAEGKVKVRVAVNYGTKSRPSAFLRVKYFAPFMESLVIPEEKSTLRLSNSDMLTPLKEDEGDEEFTSSDDYTLTESDDEPDMGAFTEEKNENDSDDLPF